MILLTAILVGKLIFFLTRLLNIGGGSAAPGYYALKIYPELLKKLASGIETQIIITGTNGKTTTSRLLGHFLKASGFRVLRNSTGSNLERGIASALISNFNLLGFKLRKMNLAIWEVDEAAFSSVVKKIKPKIIVFLNVYRDQLDRYGEVDSVVKKWQESLEGLSKETLVLLNSDDPNVSKLENFISGKVEKFGIKGPKIEGEGKTNKKTTTTTDYEAKNVKTYGLESTRFQLTMNHEPLTINLPLPGIYHIYDFLAAFGVAFNLNLTVSEIIESVKNYSPAFGRFEKVEIGGKEVYIFLIKNPTGATQVFETIKSELKQGDLILAALNDNFADGTDVSWIWDAEWEKIKNQKSKIKIIVSGIRAEDMAVRLKYAGFSNLVVEHSLGRAFNKVVSNSNGRVFVLPTYTAMLELQNILAKKGLKEHYWKEAQ